MEAVAGQTRLVVQPLPLAITQGASFTLAKVVPRWGENPVVGTLEEVFSYTPGESKTIGDSAPDSHTNLRAAIAPTPETEWERYAQRQVIALAMGKAAGVSA